MSLDRIARLIHLAAADSDIVSALQYHPANLKIPLGLSDDHVRVLKRASVLRDPQKTPLLSTRKQTKQVKVDTKNVSSPTKSMTKAAVALAPTTDAIVPNPNALLPPEGQGQPSIPILTNLPPLTIPAPVLQPGPVPSPGPVGPQPSPSPGAQPTAAPVISPVGQPAPFRAPTPVGSFPWQNPPSPTGMGRAPIYPLPAIPVFRQPQPASGTVQNLYGPAIPTPENRPCVSEPPPIQTAPSPASAGGCDCCCLQVTALVATVTATSQSAITAITAVARLQKAGCK
jgi:hypothetical protein